MQAHRRFTHAAYSGHIDEVGHCFDSNGRYRGSVSSDGAFFDEHGVYRGHIDGHGRVRDERARLDAISVEARKSPRPSADALLPARRSNSKIA